MNIYDDEKREQTTPQFTKEETKYIIRGALGASLLIAGIFILGAFLFILFCSQIWLK